MDAERTHMAHGRAIMSEEELIIMASSRAAQQTKDTRCLTSSVATRHLLREGGYL